MSSDFCPRCKGSGREPKMDRIVMFGDGRSLACEGRGSRHAGRAPGRIPPEERRPLIGSRNLPLLISN